MMLNLSIELNNLHPVLKFLTIIVMAVVCRSISVSGMCLCIAMMAILLGKDGNLRWARILSKMRWLLLVMLLVYAYNTPGEYLGADSLMPTYEGLHMGCNQLLYISLLSGLILWVQQTTSQQHQVYAVYQMLFPFMFSQQFRERVAVRWALTMTYAEQYLENNAKIQLNPNTFLERIRQIIDSIETEPLVSIKLIQISRPNWSIYDSGYCLCLLVGFIYALSAWN